MTVLPDPGLRARWEVEVAEIRDRIHVAGMSEANMGRLCDAIASVL